METTEQAMQAAQETDREVEAMLAQMAGEGRRAAINLVGRGVPAKAPIPKFRYTHDAMVDLILENPWISQIQLAEYFGFTPAWASTIVRSDAFKAKLEARRAEVMDPELRATLRERFEALTAQSLEVLQKKLSKPTDQIRDQLVLKAAELGAKALGLGGNAAPQVVVASEERLANLAHRLIALRGQPTQEIVNVEAREAIER